MRILSSVVLTVDRICSSNDTATGVQRGMDSCFGNCDGLLFHYFVDCYSIDVAHFIKFVDTNDSSVCENHGSCFETTFTSFFVCGNCCSKTNARGTSSRCCNSQWSGIQYES